MKRQQPSPGGNTPLRRKVVNAVDKKSLGESNGKKTTQSNQAWGFLESLSKMLDPWAPGGFYFYLFLTTVLLFFFTMGLTSNVIEIVFIFSDVAIVVACLVACYMVYKS